MYKCTRAHDSPGSVFPDLRLQTYASILVSSIPVANLARSKGLEEKTQWGASLGLFLFFSITMPDMNNWLVWKTNPV